MIVDYIRSTSGQLLAVHFSKLEEVDKATNGVRFLTENEWEQQIATISKKKGEVIQKHIHPPLLRSVYNTPETLIVKKGSLTVDLYDGQKCWIRRITLSEGEILLQLTGGHGFVMLTDVELIEVKQGCYAGDKDKIRF